MADVKKYVGQEALQQVITEVKAADAAVLQSMKEYCDSKDKNFDASGSAATAETNAKKYTDEKIAPLATTEALNAVDGKVTSEETARKAADETLQANIDAVDDKADKNAEDIAAINNAETGILKQAKDYTDTEVAKVQGETDNLETFVGVIPEGYDATTIAEYAKELADNVAANGYDDTALSARVSQAEKDIDAIEADYLKDADKTELSNAIATEKQRAEGIESGLRTDVDAIKGDYLKTSDKNELQSQITENANAITLLTDGVDAEKVDGVKDLIAYVEEHGTEVTGMKEDIAENASDIEDVAGRVTILEGEMDAVEGAVATKAEKTYVDEQIETLEGADSELAERLSAVEGKLGTGEGSVDSKIATVKQEAVDTAAQDATTKANTAESNSKAYTDTEVGKDRARLDALEAIDHEHANKEELDLIATGDKVKWDAAAAKAHEHANSDELNKIADGDVAKWNAAEGNAKTYADNLNSAMTTKVDGIDGRVGNLETTIVDKAEQDDLDALEERILTAEANITTNTAAINAFVAITPAEVTAMWA